MNFFQTSIPFASSDWIYELSLPGIRCIAYLNESETDLRCFDNQAMLPFLPELVNLHQQVRQTCVLDGVLIVLKDGIPDESALWQRIQTKDSCNQHLSLVSYVAYDVLYVKDRLITQLPLIQRKILLEYLVAETVDITISRFQDDHCNELMNLAKSQNLNGVMAKRKDSVYLMDQSTNQWIQFFTTPLIHSIVCGLLSTDDGTTYYLFARYKDDILVYQGRIPSTECQFPVDLTQYISAKQVSICNDCPCSIMPVLTESKLITWFEPTVVCLLELSNMVKPILHQAKFRGICEDILPTDCQINLH